MIKIEGIDLRTASKTQLDQIARLILTDMTVVIKNQTLTVDQQIQITQTIGNIFTLPDNIEDYETLLSRYKDIWIADGVGRVTGRKNERGEVGIFGHKEEVDWHTDRPSDPIRSPFGWLYAVSGTKGSVTSYLNNVESYSDLDEEFKEEIKDIQINQVGLKHGDYSPSKFFDEHMNNTDLFNVVHTNSIGATGLFFPFYQIFGFKDKDKKYFEQIKNKLVHHITQKKYIYDHKWEDGDVVITEMNLTLHKRWAFKQIENRLLHRISFGHENVPINPRTLP